MTSSPIARFRGENFFLSNFFPSAFDVPSLGMTPTAEHAFNALKTSDPTERAWVLSAATPAEAKHRGRSVALIPGWEEGGRVAAMRLVLAAKFSVPDLKVRLLATGDAVLLEGNTHHDNFWGDCTCGATACESTGENQLGRLLMDVRLQLHD